MRIGEFFTGVKNKAQAYAHRIGTGIRKIVPKVLKYGGAITNVLSKAPGALGTVAGLVNKGINTANKIISALPDSGLKDKLQNIENKASSATASVYNAVLPTANKIKAIGDTGQAVMDQVKQII